MIPVKIRDFVCAEKFVYHGGQNTFEPGIIG